MKLGKEYGLPILIPRAFLQQMPEEMAGLVEQEFILVDMLYMIYAESPELSWSEQYRRMIEDMKPGLNQIIVHPGFDDQELRAIAGRDTPFGSAWRQRDLDFVAGGELRDLLDKNGIHLVGWKEIREVL